MTTMHLDAFDTTLQKTHEWLNEICEEMAWEDRHKAYLVLRATLHALRDRLPMNVAIHLGAQLPMLVRGFYYDGWSLKESPRKDRHKEQFLVRVRSYFALDPYLDAEEAVRAVFDVLARHISPGELETICVTLPREIRALMPE